MNKLSKITDFIITEEFNRLDFLNRFNGKYTQIKESVTTHSWWVLTFASISTSELFPQEDYKILKLKNSVFILPLVQNSFRPPFTWNNFSQRIFFIIEYLFSHQSIVILANYENGQRKIEMLEISYSERLKIRKKDYKINSFYVKINTLTAQTMLLTKLVDVKKYALM